MTETKTSERSCGWNKNDQDPGGDAQQTPAQIWRFLNYKTKLLLRRPGTGTGQAGLLTKLRAGAIGVEKVATK